MAKSKGAGAGGRGAAIVPGPAVSRAGPFVEKTIKELLQEPPGTKFTLDISANAPGGVQYWLEGGDFGRAITPGEGEVLYQSWRKNRATLSPVKIRGNAFNGEAVTTTPSAPGLKYVPSPWGSKGRDLIIRTLRGR